MESRRISNIWARFFWHFFQLLGDSRGRILLQTRNGAFSENFCRLADLARCWSRLVAATESRPLVDSVARLKELGIEYQLQLAQLHFLVPATLILQKLAVGNQFQLVRRRRTWSASKIPRGTPPLFLPNPFKMYVFFNELQASFRMNDTLLF